MRRFRRDKDHRKALMVNLAKNLLIHKSIKTTLPKAKDLREFIEPIINRSKEDSLHNRRIVAKKLMNDWTITKILFEDIAAHIKERKGGYLRILRCAVRKGDGATVGLIQFVDIPKVNNRIITNEITNSQDIPGQDFHNNSVEENTQNQHTITEGNVE
jgi:large subunit ribosomal protein L17